MMVVRDTLGVDCAFDRLGFLQFQQLWATLMKLEGGIAVDAWLGEAESLSVGIERHTACPAVGDCWDARAAVGAVRVGSSGQRDELLEAVGLLVFRRPEDFAVAFSFVLLTNLDVPAAFAREVSDALGRSRVRVSVLGPRELGVRVDARAELRRETPSVLGLRDLDGVDRVRGDCAVLA